MFALHARSAPGLLGRFLVLALAAGLPSRPALADAIDGDWCHGAQSLTIAGPRIRTPEGAEMTGDYNRHGFRYVVPDGAPQAGSEVVMVLNSEELMTLVRRSGGTQSQPESWRRCKPVS